MAFTLKQWQKNEQLRNSLLEVLNNPTFIQAVDTLMIAYLPTAPASITIDGETRDLTTVLALRHMHRAGFYGFMVALRNLALPAEAQKPEPPSWGMLYPEPE